MSEIAQALAKAKERTGPTTAPFLTPGGSTSPFVPVAPPVRRVRNSQIFWVVLVCVALPLTAFVLWSQLKDATPAASTATPSADVAPSSMRLPVVAAQFAGSSAQGAAAAPAPNPPIPQRPELLATVSSLSISAVMPGEPPRIVVAGRVVRAGEAVDSHLTFSGIAEGQLRFIDARGAIYSRRY